MTRPTRDMGIFNIWVKKKNDADKHSRGMFNSSIRVFISIFGIESINLVGGLGKCAIQLMTYTVTRVQYKLTQTHTHTETAFDARFHSQYIFSYTQFMLFPLQPFSIAVTLHV